MGRWKLLTIHVTLIAIASMTLLPLAFMVNNIFRSNHEFYRSFFSVPDAVKGLASVTGSMASGDESPVEVDDQQGQTRRVPPDEAAGMYIQQIKRGPKMAWAVLRPYLINSLVVSLLTALGVCAIGSSTAYILSRYRFMGSRAALMMFIATMMFPGVLTLVPSFLLVKHLGLLNTYWAMILPYMAGGQVFAIFVFHSFFKGLPEDLFESARLDGAGHLRLYWNIVLPLSKPVFSVVIIMNVLGTWNNFLWPFITNTDGSHHVVSSGLFALATSAHAQNFSTMFAAYAISSVPLLILFVYATRPFIRGMTSGALKA